MWSKSIRKRSIWKKVLSGDSLALVCLVLMGIGLALWFRTPDLTQIEAFEDYYAVWTMAAITGIVAVVKLQKDQD